MIHKCLHIQHSDHYLVLIWQICTGTSHGKRLKFHNPINRTVFEYLPNFSDLKQFKLNLKELTLMGWNYFEFHPSIHFLPRYLRPGCGGSCLSRDTQTYLSLDTSSSTSGRIPRRSRASVSWVFLWVSSWRDMQGTRPEGGVLGCSSHLSRLSIVE